jgi:hypothetical protein
MLRQYGKHSPEGDVKEFVEDISSVLVIIAAAGLGFLFIATVLR